MALLGHCGTSSGHSSSKSHWIGRRRAETSVTFNRLTPRHNTQAPHYDVILAALKLLFDMAQYNEHEFILNVRLYLMFIGPCIIVIVENKRPT